MNRDAAPMAWNAFQAADAGDVLNPAGEHDAFPPAGGSRRPAAGRDPALQAHGRAPWHAAIAAGCLGFALVLLLPQILNDGDTLWQIRTGEWILSHHAIPGTDPFSYTAGARRWFAHEWLAEILLALAHGAGGLAGVMVLAAVAAGLATGILAWVLRHMLPGPMTAIALLLALMNTAPSLLARPHLLAWPALTAWCGALVLARARRTPPPWALLPVMLAWVNLHGSFILGLLFPIPLMIEALFDPPPNQPRRTALHWLGFIAAAWTVALLNPEGLDGVLFPFRMLGMHSLHWIKEWQPTDFSRPPVLEVMILAALATGFLGRLRLPPIRLMMVLALVHAALAHMRNQQLLGLIGVLVVAEPAGRAMLHRATVPAGTPLLLRFWAVAAAAAALCWRLSAPPPPVPNLQAVEAVLHALPDGLRDKPVLNDYALGGTLIFTGIRPFIDSRADLYGDDALERYGRMVAPDANEIAKVMAETGAAWTIFPDGTRLAHLLDEMPGWRRITSATGLVVHGRVQ